MASRATPLPTRKESQASSALHMILTEIETAKSNWILLADRLSQGYVDAYRMHKNTLSEVQRVSELDKKQMVELYYFVLQAVAIGYAGGLIGAALTPWIRGAQQLAFLKSYSDTFAYIGAEGIKGSAQEITKKAYKGVLEKLEKQNQQLDNSPYVPAFADPTSFFLDSKTILDELFVVTEGPVVELIDRANAEQWAAQVGYNILNDFRSKCPLLTDAPQVKDIPTRSNVARSTELAMWVAWANAQLSSPATSFVNGEYNMLDAGRPREDSWADNDYDWAVIHAKYLESVLVRMKELNKTNISKLVGPSQSQEAAEVLDLRKVSKLALNTPDLPFTRLTGLAQQWNLSSPLARAQYFSALIGIKPAHKK